MTLSRVPWPAAAVCLVPLAFPIDQLRLVRSPLPPVLLAALAGTGLVVLLRVAAKRPLAVWSPLLWSPLLWALGLVMLSALVSSIVAVDPAVSVRLDVAYLIGLGLAAATTLACSDGRSARLVVGCVCLVGAGICGHGVLTATSLVPHYGGALVENRATGIFGQPNELGAFAVLVVMLSVALFVSSGRRSMSWVLAGVSGVAGLTAAAVTLSRGAWLGLALGFAVLVVLIPAVRRPMVVILAVAATTLTAVSFALPAQPLASILVERAASVVDGQTNPYDFRPEIWHEALRQIEARPWFGVGPGGYHVLAARSPSQVAVVAPEHAHSLPVTLLAEQGVVGLVALCLAVGAAVRAVARSVRQPDVRPSGRIVRPGAGASDGAAAGRDRNLLAGIAATLAVVLGQGLIDYPLRNPVLETFVWLLVGLLAALATRRPDEVTGTPATATRARALVGQGPGPAVATTGETPTWSR